MVHLQKLNNIIRCTLCEMKLTRISRSLFFRCASQLTRAIHMRLSMKLGGMRGEEDRREMIATLRLGLAGEETGDERGNKKREREKEMYSLHLKSYKVAKSFITEYF